MTRQTRSTAIVALCVLLLHAGALWALHRGLLSRAPEVSPLPPMQVRLVKAAATALDAPQASDAGHARERALPKPAQPKRPPWALRQDRTPAQPRVARQAVPAPVRPGDSAMQSPKQPSAAAEPTPASAKSAVAPTPAASADPGLAKDSGVFKPTGAADDATGATPAALAMTGPASAAAHGKPAPVQRPSSDASYLQNQRPPYPPISRKLGEQGTVLVDVLVTEQGQARDARLHASSGFFRLDNAAVSTVSSWRFVPGKRAGVAQSMRVTVTIVFELQ